MHAIRFFLAVLVFVVFPAKATPLTYNASDIWWIPGESGWGLNLIHQGNTAFATLYVYDQGGRAHWYSASNLVTPGDGAAHDQPLVFSGELHETTGPAFGGSFDPNAVVRRLVGTMTFQMDGPRNGRVTYSVDNVAVTRNVQRYMFRLPDISGSYIGNQLQPAEGGRATVNDAMSITIQQSGQGITMTTVGSASGTCNYTGVLEPYGQLADVGGTFTCGDGRSGPFRLMELDVTRHGFTARMTGNLITAPFQGRFGGTRTASGAARGDGWRTDLWWVPGESGWGINVIEQGDVLFSTFFVYDTDGRAKWYSASLVFAGMSPNLDGSGRYTGTVYESTGPYFAGSTYNPGSVTYRAAGTATMEVLGNRTAWLDYDIDGRSGRKVLDRFTFRINDPSGSYSGHMNALADPRGVPTGATAYTISLASGTLTVNTQAAGGNCTFTAPFNDAFQYGQHLLVAGNFTCTNGTSGTFTFYDVNVSYAGFTAAYDIGGYVVGRLGGVRAGVF